MATRDQLKKVSELLQNGWSRAVEPANLDPDLVPFGLPVELRGPDGKKWVVPADGKECLGELDWDQYCTGGKADWSHRPTMY